MTLNCTFIYILFFFIKIFIPRWNYDKFFSLFFFLTSIIYKKSAVIFFFQFIFILIKYVNWIAMSIYTNLREFQFVNFLPLRELLNYSPLSSWANCFYQSGFLILSLSDNSNFSSFLLIKFAVIICYGSVIIRLFHLKKK